MCVYIYMYKYALICVCIYIYIHVCMGALLRWSRPRTTLEFETCISSNGKEELPELLQRQRVMPTSEQPIIMQIGCHPWPTWPTCVQGSASGGSSGGGGKGAFGSKSSSSPELRTRGFLVAFNVSVSTSRDTDIYSRVCMYACMHVCMYVCIHTYAQWICKINHTPPGPVGCNPSHC